MPRLLVNPGTAQQWEIPLKPGANTFGRSPACDTQIDHGSISGTHCQIVVNGDVVSVKDLGSTNGTFLNHIPVSEGILVPGQRLQLGGVEMELIADPPKASSAPAPMRVTLAGAVPAPPPPAAIAPSKPVLHITSHETPPPPPSVPAAYVPDEYAEAPEAPSMCKYHPRDHARFMCPQCQLHFCELCVTTRPGGERTGKFCRKCSAECVAMNVQLIVPVDHHANFFSSIPGAFAYPLKAKSLTFLICGTIFFAVVDFLGSYSWYLQAVYTGYTFAYLQRIIHTAAQGTDEAPGWPDISAFWDDIMIPFFQTLGLMLVSFGPTLLVAIYVGKSLDTSGVSDPVTLVINNTGLFALFMGTLLAGAVYYPMALLAVAMFDSIVSANPLVVIPAILRVPLEYLTIVVIAGVFFAMKLGENFLSQLIPVPGLSALIIAAISLYFLTVQGRLLGLMYYARREKLGWFSR